MIIYFILITGSTYAYLYLENSNSNSITGTGKCDVVNYKGEDINSNDLVSTTNYLEGVQSKITLSQNENCKIYTSVNIYLYTNDTTTAPIEEVSALKYKLFQNDSLLSEGTITKKGETLLATVPLTVTPIDYDIYLYVDSNVSKGSYNEKNYSGYIFAESSQTSTISNNETTITYDYNYLINDSFDEYYDINSFEPCSGSGTIKEANTYYDDVGRVFSVTATKQGWYFQHKQELKIGSTYTIIFEAKASTNLTAIIKSEQSQISSSTIGTSWKRYTYTFLASDTVDDKGNKFFAFIFYYWFGEEERTLEIRNLQIQEGNPNNVVITKKPGEKINELMKVTRKGYQFLGWYTDPIEGEKITEDTIVPNSNVTYYAHYKYLNT